MLRHTFLIYTSTLAVLLAGTFAARAQDPGAAAAAAPLPADVRKVLSDVADLDLLDALTPLKLTQRQIDKLLAPMKAAAASGEETRKKDFDAVRGLISDVAKARAEALKGSTIPADLEKRVNTAFADLDARAVAGRKDAVSKILAVVKSTFTTEQVAFARQLYPRFNMGKIAVPQDLKKDPDKVQDFVDDVVLTAFVERILLPERAPGLLTALRASSPATIITTPPPPSTATAAKP